jgi:hypothetical protein
MVGGGGGVEHGAVQWERATCQSESKGRSVMCEVIQQRDHAVMERAWRKRG